ncbi:MAG: LysR family transcriptional regulator substrate-binding protein [Clostridiales bacterium]|nr:LysR family transcriptional regulator substrate-binding protein [Clostridiales bacterium]
MEKKSPRRETSFCRKQNCASNFQIRYKNIHVSFASGSAMQLIEGMNSRQYDAILLFRATIDGFCHIGVMPDAEIEELFTVEKCVVYSDKNDVCTQGNVTLDSFREQTLLVLKNDQLPNSIVTNDELFQHIGWRPKIQMLPNADSICMGLLAGTGYAITDDSARIVHYNSIRHIPLGKEHTVCLVTPKSASHGADILREYLQSRYRNETI